VDVLDPPVKLLPGERIVRVQQLDLTDAPEMPDALEELCKLTEVERPEEIGENGPPVGARVSDANAGEGALRLFEIVFGRDSLTVSLIVADLFPRLLESTLLHLARFQGSQFDAFREEEPGRIPHEIRDIESDGVWGFPYYGSVDATPLFVLAAARAIRTRPSFEPEIRDGLDAAVEWLLRRLAADELGLLSHLRANPDGLENQVWKDSWDSLSHADGTVSNRTAPVASLEAQAIAYDALLAVGRQAAAERLARAVERHFWVGDFYAAGVDRDPTTNAPRPLATHTSNMGWLLGSRLLDGRDERCRQIVDLLFSDEFLADGGIRTLSAREVRFRPRAYHNGNVWGFDNYLISLGLERRGFVDEAQDLRDRVARACRATHRFPEFVAGGAPDEPLIARRIVDVYDESHDHANRIEQPPQEIQGWTVAAMVAIEHGG
jgi:glycogen debranching enzyme